MKASRFNVLPGPWRPSARASWTCPQCRSSPIQTEARRCYSRSRQPRPIRLIRNTKSVNRIYLAVAGLGVAGSSYLLRDDIKHWYNAVARSGRVVSTLYVNIQEWACLFRYGERSKLMTAVTEPLCDNTITIPKPSRRCSMHATNVAPIELYPCSRRTAPYSSSSASTCRAWATSCPPNGARPSFHCRINVPCPPSNR